MNSIEEQAYIEGFMSKCAEYVTPEDLDDEEYERRRRKMHRLLGIILGGMYGILPGSVIGAASAGGHSGGLTPSQGGLIGALGGGLAGAGLGAGAAEAGLALRDYMGLSGVRGQPVTHIGKDGTL